MPRDTLDTLRIVDNLIVQVNRLAERIARLEERVAAVESGGQVIVREESSGAPWELIVEDVDGELAWLKMREL